MRDQKLLRPDALQAREATGQPSPIQKPKISSTTYDKPQRATETNLAGHLQTLASELNYASPKPFGEHLTLLHASVSGNSLSISMRINNHTAEDPAAQIALSNFNSGITAYYCESEPYGRLITQGATIIPTLYGKDSASIGAYPITISNCKK